MKRSFYIARRADGSYLNNKVYNTLGGLRAAFAHKKYYMSRYPNSYDFGTFASFEDYVKSFTIVELVGGQCWSPEVDGDKIEFKL